jgi:hypothetical protein
VKEMKGLGPADVEIVLNEAPHLQVSRETVGRCGGEEAVARGQDKSARVGWRCRILRSASKGLCFCDLAPGFVEEHEGRRLFSCVPSL